MPRESGKDSNDTTLNLPAIKIIFRRSSISDGNDPGVSESGCPLPIDHYAEGMEWEIVFGALALAAGIFVLGFFLSHRSWRSIRTNYRTLADKHGLDLTQPEAKGFGLFQASPYLFGVWEGRKTSVQTVTAGLKDSRQAETAIHLETDLRPDCILMIRSKRGLNRIERSEFKNLSRVGGPGDEFDKRISIASNRPDWISERITAPMCARILNDLGSTAGTILLVKGRLTYRETGLLSGARALDRIERMMVLLKWLADSLEDGPEMPDE